MQFTATSTTKIKINELYRTTSLDVGTTKSTLTSPGLPPVMSAPTRTMTIKDYENQLAKMDGPKIYRDIAAGRIRALKDMAKVGKRCKPRDAEITSHYDCVGGSMKVKDKMMDASRHIAALHKYLDSVPKAVSRAGDNDGPISSILGASGRTPHHVLETAENTADIRGEAADLERMLDRAIRVKGEEEVVTGLTESATSIPADGVGTGVNAAVAGIESPFKVIGKLFKEGTKLSKGAARRARNAANKIKNQTEALKSTAHLSVTDKPKQSKTRAPKGMCRRCRGGNKAAGKCTVCDIPCCDGCMSNGKCKDTAACHKRHAAYLKRKEGSKGNHQRKVTCPNCQAKFACVMPCRKCHRQCCENCHDVKSKLCKHPQKCAAARIVLESLSKKDDVINGAEGVLHSTSKSDMEEPSIYDDATAFEREQVHAAARYGTKASLATFDSVAKEHAGNKDLRKIISNENKKLSHARNFINSSIPDQVSGRHAEEAQKHETVTSNALETVLRHINDRTLAAQPQVDFQDIVATKAPEVRQVSDAKAISPSVTEDMLKRDSLLEDDETF